MTRYIVVKPAAKQADDLVQAKVVQGMEYKDQIRKRFSEAS
jgi:hypothetical protein